jgi:hypothetical protein
MCSTRYDVLTREFPEEVAAIQRLEETARRFADRELPVQRLYALVQPSSVRILALIMHRASEAGLAQRFFRVQSERRGGIGEDFTTIQDIPAEIYDSRLGHIVEVKPEQIAMFFRFPDGVHA